MERIGTGARAGNQDSARAAIVFRSCIAGDDIELHQGFHAWPYDLRLRDHLRIVDAVEKQFVGAVTGAVGLDRRTAGAQFVGSHSRADGAGWGIGQAGNAGSDNCQLGQVSSVQR